LKKWYALSKFDSQSELARQLGISNQAVNQWHEDIPLLREYQIHDILDGREPGIVAAEECHYVHPRRGGGGVPDPEWWEFWKWL
jgi:hypothetical protein